MGDKNDSALIEVRKFISYRIAEGFDSAHQVIAQANAFAQESFGREDLQPEIMQITAELLREHLVAQADWDGPTDCDRLDQAFAKLNELGIVARQDFTCCNNCGFTEIWDEVEVEEKQRKVEGYVFYHLQCTEQAIESGRLLLAYGCVDEDIDQFNRVASAIVEELNRCGLTASWKGSTSDPIIVDGIIWRRRR